MSCQLSSAFNVDDVITSIQLEINHPSSVDRVWLVIEGESDYHLYQSLLLSNVSVEEIPGGFTDVELVVSTLLQKTNRVIGIIDKDFHWLKGYSTKTNIFITDYHDIEMMMLFPDECFVTLLQMYIKDQKHANISIRSQIFEILVFYSSYKWINMRDTIKLKFRGVGLGSFFNQKTLKFNKTECINIINSRSKNKERVVDIQEIESVSVSSFNLFDYVCGHDAIEVLSMYIRNFKKGIPSTDVTSTLRGIYVASKEFAKTNLYNDLVGWAQAESIKLLK